MSILSGKLNAIKINNKHIFNENYFLTDIIVCIKVVFEQCNFKSIYFTGKDITFINCSFENCSINIKNVHIR